METNPNLSTKDDADLNSDCTDIGEKDLDTEKKENVGNKGKDLKVVESLGTLPTNFPLIPSEIDQEKAQKKRSTIQKSSGQTADGKTLIGVEGVKAVLATDDTGTRIVVSDMDDDDKVIENGKTYVKTPAVIKVLNERIEQPRDALKIAELKDSIGCLEAVRDNSSSVQKRAIQEVKNRQGQKKLKIDAKLQTTTCALSGQPLDADAEMDHVIRQAEEPEKSLCIDNVRMVNKSEHRKRHREENAESKQWMENNK
ncbi:hypothetical protein [Pseudoalteromonas sp. DY56-GL79]|uniref:hypothetical protein n=1 Tax=Pseudoalteromonas sp. DY56-GL79 TaxID=2967131 RepID=UPI00352AB583